jgi:hypothetical protein
VCRSSAELETGTGAGKPTVYDLCTDRFRRRSRRTLPPAHWRSFSSAQGQVEKGENLPQEAIGDAIGLASSLGAGLAISGAAMLPSGEAGAGLASIDASGAGVSSDLEQAVVAKNIEKRAKMRIFRITTSLSSRSALAKRSACWSALRIL